MSTPRPSIGLAGSRSLVVGAAHTAQALGSGSEAVFATPAMIALMEAAACAALLDHLEPGQISLGTRINVEHLAASRLGAQVTASAEVTAVEGRNVHFAVSAHEGDKLIGRGTHLRAVVDRERFLAKL